MTPRPLEAAPVTPVRRDPAPLIPGDGEAEEESIWATLSDGFDGVALNEKWTVYDPNDNLTVQVADSELGLAIDAGGGGEAFWYGAFQGPLVSQEVTGDFEVVAVLRIRNAADDGLPPDSDYRFAGLMAHDPDRDSSLNYVACTLGSLHTPGEGNVAIYVSTEDSESEPQGGNSPGYDATEWPSGEGQIRLLRQGQLFTCSVRNADEDPWLDFEVIDRTGAELPMTLEVGLALYSAAPSPDIRVYVDSVVFGPGS